MGESSGIQWTHHTFNPWIGCAEVSPACDNCYARTSTKRLEATQRNRGKIALPLWGAIGDRYVTSESNWRTPLRWDRAAAKAGERHRVFCASLADVFEDRRDLDPLRARLRSLIQQTPHLDWLLLTKRIDRAGALMGEATERAYQDGGLLGDPDPWPENVWIGTTVEDQQRANERIPHLLRIPARVRFLSVEPQIEQIVMLPSWILDYDYSGGRTVASPRVDWVICGGESGPRARPLDLAWARSLRDQCKASGVPFFMKQLGAHVRWDGFASPEVPIHHGLRSEDDGRGGWRAHLRDSHGGDMSEWPEDLRVRQFPVAA